MWELFLPHPLYNVLTGSISSSCLLMFVPWTAGPELTGNDNCCKGKEDCDENAYDVVIPASQTRLRLTVTGNATVTIFKNLAQSELNTKYILEYGHFVVEIHWNLLL